MYRFSHAKNLFPQGTVCLYQVIGLADQQAGCVTRVSHIRPFRVDRLIKSERGNLTNEDAMRNGLT